MEIVDVEEKLNSELKRDFRGMKDGFVQVGDRKWFYPSKYREVAEDLKNFEVRHDDIWITGYPRSGTTLTQELVWLLSHNLNIDEAKSVSLCDRVKFFEWDLVLNEKTIQEIVDSFPQEAAILRKSRYNLKSIKDIKTRRVIKTHLPFELLPSDVLKKGCKIIYICRFPKDVCVSYFNLQVNNRGTDFSANFEKYWEYFQNGHSMFGPYFEHVKQGFDRIGSKNFMFTFYEEFNKDTRAHIKNLSQFLEVSLSDDDLDKLKDHIHIDNFRQVTEVRIKNRNNEAIDFIRKGKVGGWTEYFTGEINTDADKWIETNTRRIGIKYPQQKQ